MTDYGGQSIDYDAIGNPISYRGATLTWGNGRELRGYVGGGNTITYTYDDAGLRTSKTVNGAKSTYLYVGGQLQGEVRDGHHIHYSYDSYGNLSVIKYYTNDTDYHLFYVMTNAQGDVVSLHNANGTMKVSYEYDAWGNVVNMTDTSGVGIGTINPFRYRGYYYDEETGLYYLTSRYYDPEVGRFINADDSEIIAFSLCGVTDKNLYAYCDNNPVIRFDLGGQFWDIIFDAVSLVASAIDVISNPSDPLAWASLAADTASLLIPGFTGGGSIVKATSKVKKAAKYTVGTANQVGKIGEQLAGITKNTKKFLVNGRWRIPDGITKKYIQEVKNVKSLSLTSQIKDSIKLAKNQGKRLQLFIRPDTKLSKPLKDAIKKHKIKVTKLW